MSDQDSLHDAIQTVVKRTEILDRLARGPASKRDLRDDLGVSRSTVYKAVRDLEDENLVERTDDGPRLTLYGRLLFENYRSFVETAADVNRQQTLLSILSPDAPVTTDLLADADLVRAERHAPGRPLDVIEDIVQTAERVDGFAPVAFRRFVDLFHEQLLSGDLCADLVMERDVMAYLQSDFGDQFEESIADDCCRIWATDESLPFGLLVAEGDREEVAIVVYDEEGNPEGAIRNDASAALDWGRDVFERYRADATRVEPP